MAVGLQEAEVHFHFREDDRPGPPLSWSEIFFPREDDMRSMSLVERVQTYLLSWGNDRIRYPHVEISFSPQFVYQCGLWNSVETSLSFDEICAIGHRVAISARGRSTFMGTREFTADGYRTLFIRCAESSARRMLEYGAANNQKPFLHGLFQTFIIPTPPDGRTWFCAQFIVQCAKQGGMFCGVNPSEMTGDTIYAMLREFYAASETTQPSTSRKYLESKPQLPEAIPPALSTHEYVNEEMV